MALYYTFSSGGSWKSISIVLGIFLDIEYKCFPTSGINTF